MVAQRAAEKMIEGSERLAQWARKSNASIPYYGWVMGEEGGPTVGRKLIN